MGPNNGENQSGGVATLETPQATAPEAGSGLLPTPGASAPEAAGVIAQAENIAANAWVGADQPAATPATETGTATTTPSGTEASTGANPALPEVKPLDPTKPFISPDMKSASATVVERNAQQSAFQAQQSKERTGWGNKILGFVGLRGSAKVESVPPTNAVPDHLKDGVTPPVPNVTPEAAAAVNQEPVKLSSTEMDAAMKQGAMEGKAILEPAPDSLKTPATEAPTAATQDGLSPMGTEVPAAPIAEPSISSSSTDTPAASVENTGMDAINAVKEADDIVKNAAGTGAALDEIDKTATDGMSQSAETKAFESATASPDSAPSAFPSYDVQSEADKVASAADALSDKPAEPTTAATPEPSPSWPATPAAEPTSSGPAAEPAAPTLTTPTTPEYQPSAGMTPAGEATAPSTPANWSIDASAAHPDAPVVGSVPPAPEASSPLSSPEPNALNLEASPTPLPGAAAETPPPFGTGMPPSFGETAAPTVAAPTEPLTPTPTAPEPVADPTISSVSTTASSEVSNMDVVGQAGQVAAAAEVSEGALPTDGASSPTIENTSSAIPTENVPPSSGSVLEQAAVVADAAGASTLGTPQEASSMAEPTLAGVGTVTEPAETPTGNGTGTPPLATS